VFASCADVSRLVTFAVKDLRDEEKSEP